METRLDSLTSMRAIVFWRAWEEADGAYYQIVGPEGMAEVRLHRGQLPAVQWHGCAPVPTWLLRAQQPAVATYIRGH